MSRDFWQYISCVLLSCISVYRIVLCVCLSCVCISVTYYLPCQAHHSHLVDYGSGVTNYVRTSRGNRLAMLSLGRHSTFTRIPPTPYTFYDIHVPQQSTQTHAISIKVTVCMAMISISGD